MTEILGHPQLTLSLDEVLRERARAVGDAGPAPVRAYSHRIGMWLRTGTVAADATALACSMLWLGVAAPGRMPLVLPPLTLAWLLLLRSWGAYRRGIGYTLSAELRTIALSGFSGALLLLQLGPWVGLHVTASTGAAIGIPVALLGAVRILLRGTSVTLRKRKALVRRVLLVGDGPDAFELLENIEAWPGLGVEVVGICADTTLPAVHGLPVLGLSRSCVCRPASSAACPFCASSSASSICGAPASVRSTWSSRGSPSFCSPRSSSPSRP
jgi:hypothetical protein